MQREYTFFTNASPFSSSTVTTQERGPAAHPHPQAKSGGSGWWGKERGLLSTSCTIWEGGRRPLQSPSTPGNPEENTPPSARPALGCAQSSFSRANTALRELQAATGSSQGSASPPPPPPPTLGPQAPSVSEPPLATRLPGPGGPAGPGPYVGNVGPEEDGAFSLPPLYISRPDGCVPREPVSSCPRAGVTRQHLTLSPS